MRNNEERQKIMEEKQEAFKKHLEMLLQLEMDADREIEELKEMFEHQLAQEKDEKVFRVAEMAWNSSVVTMQDVSRGSGNAISTRIL